MMVREIMSKEVVTVRPETPLKEVARILAERRISGVPVVAPDGAVLGVVSERDVLFKERQSDDYRGPLGWLFEDTEVVRWKHEAREAGDTMTTPAITIASGRPVADAARLMLDMAVNRLPVVDSGRLVGIVTRADLVRAFARPDREIEREIVEDVLVGMRSDGFTVAVDEGQVVLAGEVESKQLARSIVEFVERVPGVVGVESNLSWQDEH